MRLPKKFWIPLAAAGAIVVANKVDKRFGSPARTRVAQAATAASAKVTELRNSASTTV